jgi:hypothetical protein
MGYALREQISAETVSKHMPKRTYFACWFWHRLLEAKNGGVMRKFPILNGVKRTETKGGRAAAVQSKGANGWRGRAGPSNRKFPKKAPPQPRVSCKETPVSIPIRKKDLPFNYDGFSKSRHYIFEKEPLCGRVCGQGYIRNPRRVSDIHSLPILKNSVYTLCRTARCFRAFLRSVRARLDAISGVEPRAEYA